MKNIYYWAILIVVAILIGATFLITGGVFERNEGINNGSIGFVKKNIVSEKSKNTNASINDYKPEKVDIADTNTDFESDPEDFNNNSDDVKGLDDNINFDSIDSEIH